MSSIPEHLEFAKNLPSKPGVYKYFNEEAVIIYVGKAKNLKSRVSSYFQHGADLNRKTRSLIKKIAYIEYTLVKTEYDALLLENNLIKNYQPKYNILLKDGKSYPYLKITKERFPRLISTRRVDTKSGKYFGPYTKSSVPRTLLNLLEKSFFLRNCNYNLSEENIAAGKYKECMEYHIGNCLAPCTGKQNEQEYLTNIEEAKNILSGKYQSALSHLTERMETYAGDLKFEQAQLVKSKIESLKGYQKVSEVTNPKLGSMDVVTCVSSDTKAYLNIMRVENGYITSSDNIQYKKQLAEVDQDIITHTVISKGMKGPILLSNIELDTELLQSSKLEIEVPIIGDKRKVVELSLRNAIEEKNRFSDFADKDSKSRVLETLKADLRLQTLPTHIECFDNSNIQGTNPVASMVCFKMGKPSKKDYRHFKIKTVVGPDDFGSMEEIVARRYSRVLREELPIPQLVLIDGGKGQLSAAMKAFKAVGIYEKVTVIGIAKRLEEIYYPNDSDPLYISKKSESLKLLQQLRDEAHRFAITFHRKKRSDNFLISELDTIKGIGPSTKELLLERYKTIARIKEAPHEELAALIGLSKSTLIIDGLSIKGS